MLSRLRTLLSRVFTRRGRGGDGAVAPGRRLPAGLAAPRHLGDIWHALQEIAREEDPRFRDVSVVEHFNASGEGVKDVNRWLEIYQRRLDPARKFRFPAHHRRHRGYCLVARNWPDGLRWDAFDEDKLFRAPIPRAPDEESLVRALDEYLDSRALAGS